MRRSKRKTSSPYARAKPNKMGENKATHEENEENPRDAVPVVQPETAMSSGTHLSTSETSEVVRQPITGIPEIPNIDLSIANPLVSVTETLGIHIPHSIKVKIWNCEYVQLEKMLDNDNTQPENEQKLVIIDGQITFKPKENDKKNLNIETWTNAFLTFASIFISRHPSEAQGLLKYIHTIRLGASRQSTLGWKTYDQQFRLRKGIDPSKKWDSVDAELWLLYMNQTVSGGIYHNRQSTGAEQFGTSSPLGQAGGKCYDFNYRGYCTRNICTYVHTCIKCNQAHPALSCQSNVGQGMSQRLSTFSRPRTPGSVNQFRGPMNTQIQARPQFPTFRKSFPVPPQSRYMGTRKVSNQVRPN